MILQVILEGIGLGAILMLVCAFGIRKGAVGMVHLYHDDVQRRCIQLGLTTRVLVCVYAINGARGFVAGFWQLLVILSLMNLIDRLLIDGYWVGRTKAWTIPGTEDLKPYITPLDAKRKWLFGTVGVAVIAAALSGLMALIL